MLQLLEKDGVFSWGVFMYVRHQTQGVVKMNRSYLKKIVVVYRCITGLNLMELQ